MSAWRRLQNADFPILDKAMPGSKTHTVYVDLLNHKFIMTDKTYRLVSYGDVIAAQPVGSIKETHSKVVLLFDDKKWVDYFFSLKKRIDTAVGPELNLAAYDLESINQEHGYRRYTKDEDIRAWLKSTSTYQSL